LIASRSYAILSGVKLESEEMRIKVLGAYGSESLNYKSPGLSVPSKTTGFLINDSLLLDAGTICASLDLSEQIRIKNILLSHTHLDHIKGIPFLAESVLGKISQPIQILSIPEVLEDVRRHLLNDSIWPDFTKLPAAESHIFNLVALKENQPTQIDGIQVTLIRVNHVVPTVGYLIGNGRSAIVYSGDTHVTEEIWKEGRKLKDLKAAVIETSFPDEMEKLAKVSGHLTPRLLKEEFLKLGRPDLPLYVYHMKAQYLDQIRQEIGKLNMPNVTLLEDGKVFEV